MATSNYAERYLQRVEAENALKDRIARELDLEMRERGQADLGAWSAGEAVRFVFARARQAGLE